MIGVDLALSRDAAVACAVANDGNHIVTVEVQEWRPGKGAPLKLSELCADIAAFMKRNGEQSALADQHMLEPAREYLQPSNCYLEAAPAGNAGKFLVFDRVRTLMNEGKLKIPAGQRRLIQQIRECLSRPMPGGSLKIWSPRRGGSHGDILHAWALAVFGADRNHDHDLAVGRVSRASRRSFGEDSDSERPKRHYL